MFQFVISNLVNQFIVRDFGDQEKISSVLKRNSNLSALRFDGEINRQQEVRKTTAI